MSFTNKVDQNTLMLCFNGNNVALTLKKLFMDMVQLSKPPLLLLSFRRQRSLYWA